MFNKENRYFESKHKENLYLLDWSGPDQYALKCTYSSASTTVVLALVCYGMVFQYLVPVLEFSKTRNRTGLWNTITFGLSPQDYLYIVGG